MSLDSVLISPVSFSAFGHHGTMVTMCYPRLTLYPVWILFKVTHHLLIAYKIYQILLTFLTLCSAHYSMHSITRCQKSSLCFSMIYTFSLYRFANVFCRQALGEIIAMVFLPIIILGLYNIIAGDYSKKWPALAIGITGLMFTHFLSVLLAFISLVFVFLINLPLADNKLTRFTALIKAGFVTLLLSFASIISLITSAPGLFFLSGNIDTLVASALSMSQRNMMSLTNQPVSYCLGLSILAAIPITFYLMIHAWFKNRSLLRQNDSFFAVSIFCTGILTALISTNVFPWYSLNDSLLMVILFAWRLNAISTVMISFSLGFFLKDISVSKQGVSLRLLLPVLSIILLSMHFICLHNLENTGNRPITEDSIITGDHYHIDYTPFKATASIGWDWSNNYLKINGYPVEAETTVRESYYTVSFDNPYDGEAVMEVPVFWYPHLTATIDGESVESSCSDNGLVMLNVPAGNHTLTLHYSYSALVRCSQAISVLAAVLLLRNRLKQVI